MITKPSAVPILSNLKQPKYFLLTFGIAVLVFDVNYYLMKNFPGSVDEQCVMGVNFTPVNIGFAVLLSVMVGLLISGFFALFGQTARDNKVVLGSLSGLGAFVGMMTVFCTVCTIPVISLFGLSIGLEIFTDYDSVFKVLSLALLAFALYLLNRQLKRECAVCAPIPAASVS